MFAREIIRLQNGRPAKNAMVRRENSTKSTLRQTTTCAWKFVGIGYLRFHCDPRVSVLAFRRSKTDSQSGPRHIGIRRKLECVSGLESEAKRFRRNGHCCRGAAQCRGGGEVQTWFVLVNLQFERSSIGVLCTKLSRAAPDTDVRSLVREQWS